eukprot:gb/GECH01004842.1/.p1 GENE.gb/GECH01004842.1/~~gb/GECH01004842.1/.p1  ORF type:complete len:392 (+),score=77.89 gb/GECH01004842.1/:1-1176(+)
MDLQTIASNGIPMPNLPSITIFTSIIIFLAVGGIIVPGPYIPGTPLKNKKSKTTKSSSNSNSSTNSEQIERLWYKINGLRLWILSIIAYLCGAYIFKLYNATIIYDHYGPLLSTATLFSFLLSIYLYIQGVLSSETNFKTDNILLNYWHGVQLNPHILGINVKFFSYRPAFVLQALINVSAAAKQYQEYGFLSPAMILFFAINFGYMFDYFYVENCIVSTWDIIEENFGFMLVFGDYVWIPFVFSLQSLYLIHMNHTLNPIRFALTVIFFVAGYIIFRGANSQKHQFREDPKKPIWGKKPQVIETETRPLLVAGWWGIARKINYLGDILIAISWSIPCGISYFLPWLYPVYLTALLLHRAQRDDARCRTRYKKYWEQYCERVPYILIPYIY